MGTIFQIENAAKTDLILDYIMVYDGKSWETAAQNPNPDLNNDINSGFYLISIAGYVLKKGKTFDFDALFNTWVLYKNGLASDSAFLLFGIRGSNLHIGLKGEFLSNTGVYGPTPDAVRWSYSPSDPNLRQYIRVTSPTD
jgi:hypothetical protein